MAFLKDAQELRRQESGDLGVYLCSAYCEALLTEYFFFYREIRDRFRAVISLVPAFSFSQSSARVVSRHFIAFSFVS